MNRKCLQLATTDNKTRFHFFLKAKRSRYKKKQAACVSTNYWTRYFFFSGETISKLITGDHLSPLKTDVLRLQTSRALQSCLGFWGTHPPTREFQIVNEPARQIVSQAAKQTDKSPACETFLNSREDNQQSRQVPIQPARGIVKNTVRQIAKCLARQIVKQPDR